MNLPPRLTRSLLAGAVLGTAVVGLGSADGAAAATPEATSGPRPGSPTSSMARPTGCSPAAPGGIGGTITLRLRADHRRGARPRPRRWPRRHHRPQHGRARERARRVHQPPGLHGRQRTGGLRRSRRQDAPRRAGHGTADHRWRSRSSRPQVRDAVRGATPTARWTGRVDAGHGDFSQRRHAGARGARALAHQRRRARGGPRLPARAAVPRRRLPHQLRQGEPGLHDR